jgi:putative phosphoribosyl transferase
MIGETEEMVMHQALIDSFEISKDYIYSEASRKYKEKLLSYVHKYRNGKILDGLGEKYVVLVDECVETGLTMMTAIKTVISLGAKNVFIAVPILDNVVHESLLNVCDNLFCPHKIDDYISIEYYYERLDPFTFEDIDAIMDENRKKQRNN